MGIALSDNLIRWFRGICIVALVAGGAVYVVSSIHWQWMWDTAVMHYIVFLLKHGKVPYRDIYDINMPGAYLTERWAMAIFGGGDLGWRIYEDVLLGGLTAAMIVIALPYDWLAGLFAGVLYTLQIGTLGPLQAVERDEVMTVLIFISYALLFVSMRRYRAWPMFPFGFFMGIAALIKPTVTPLIVCLLIFQVAVLRQQRISLSKYLCLAILGLTLALCILLGFLLPDHAFGAFFFILHKLVPYYSSLAHPTAWVLIRRSVPQAFLLYVPLAVLLAFTKAKQVTWEIWSLRAGLVFGIFSYFVQRKGYDYHRIALVCFALLLIGLEFTWAMRDRGWRRVLGVAGLGFGCLVMVTLNARKVHARHDVNTAAFVLQKDLQELGGNELQNRVQCLDMVGGCFSALYRAGLVQSTGFTGDTQFFGPNDGKVVPYYREILLSELRKNPPSVIILSNEWYQESSYSFNKLNSWPEFRDYLNSAYRLKATEGPFELYGYSMYFRIYVLKPTGRASADGHLGS